ncbi:MAG: cytochrome c [Planctomycetes bacterium]|nr:cytochrome c [Planctomycetota bacterium]
MSRIRPVVLSVLLATVPACAERAADAPSKPVPQPVPAPPADDDDDSIPPPRPVTRKPADEALAGKGRELFTKLQCARCHTTGAKAPLLEGLYGTKVQLRGGAAETADDDYIVESIRKPRAKVVEGWEAIMPAYDEDQASAEDLNALVAYIRSLKRGDLEPKEPLAPPK